MAAGEASHVPSGIPVLLFWQSPARPRARDTVRACAELHQTTHFAGGRVWGREFGRRGVGDEADPSSGAPAAVWKLVCD